MSKAEHCLHRLQPAFQRFSASAAVPACELDNIEGHRWTKVAWLRSPRKLIRLQSVSIYLQPMKYFIILYYSLSVCFLSSFASIHFVSLFTHYRLWTCLFSLVSCLLSLVSMRTLILLLSVFCGYRALPYLHS